MKHEDIKFEALRADVVFKTILRLMRRNLTAEFIKFKKYSLHKPFIKQDALKFF